MSAIPEDFLSQSAKVDDASVKPFPNSTKIYVTGSRADIRVPMREVTLAPTLTEQGEETNPPVTVYDTSGPYTDPAVTIDIRQGLSPLRQAWIDERADTERLTGSSSVFANQRENDASLQDLRFAELPKPRRAKAGHNVTQMHYARQGIITTEMEFVA